MEQPFWKEILYFEGKSFDKKIIKIDFYINKWGSSSGICPSPLMPNSHFIPHNNHKALFNNS